jgi:molecular chaperone GrpE (heat shock protein)
MSERRQVWQTLLSILRRIEEAAEALPPVAQQPGTDGLANLEQEMRKLGKTQFKANLLAEEQAAHWEKALAYIQSTQEQNAHLLQQWSEERDMLARRDLLVTLLPVLDGLENAMASGQRYLQTRDLAAKKGDLSPGQAVLVSPADRAMLAVWLDGLRLVHERLIEILKAGRVTPIPAVGHPFDPHLHVAVGVTDKAPPGIVPVPGTIVAEERRGYQAPDSVLRFADVIVYRQ